MSMRRRTFLQRSAAAVAAISAPRWAGAGQPCPLTPSQTSGPFYFDTELVRRDITEGRPGAPLQLALDIVDANTCQPVPDAVIDVWHTDAAGLYSGYPGQGDLGIDTTGETFMRGLQVTDENGRAAVNTIYPGWYPGRVPHVHVMVHLDDRSFVTTQVYFPDAVSDAVYETGVYATRGASPVTNETDFLLRDNQLDQLILDVTGDPSGMQASRTLAIDLSPATPPTPTPLPNCSGDCDGDGRVTVSELVRGVRVALGEQPVQVCDAVDSDGNGAVTIGELVAAVNNALDGC